MTLSSSVTLYMKKYTELPPSATLFIYNYTEFTSLCFFEHVQLY